MFFTLQKEHKKTHNNPYECVVGTFLKLQCIESKCEAGLGLTGAIPHAELPHSHACMCYSAHTCTEQMQAAALHEVTFHSH